MQIENMKEDQFLEIIFLKEFDGYKTYNISGKNKRFGGASQMCFSTQSLDKFIGRIHYDDNVRLDDYDSDAYIEIKKVDNLGHYDVVYQIGGTHQSNYCKLILNTNTIGIQKFNRLSIDDYR